MEKDMWGVLIADDEPKIRRGLRAQLSRLELPLRVVAEAEDGEMALEAAEKYRPDILLVDINMPFMNGLAFISALRRTRADARIIVITGYEEFEYARQALEMNVQAICSSRWTSSVCAPRWRPPSRGCKTSGSATATLSGPSPRSARVATFCARNFCATPWPGASRPTRSANFASISTFPALCA